MKNFILSDTFTAITNLLGIIAIFLGSFALAIWVIFFIQNLKKPIEIIDMTPREIVVADTPKEFVPEEVPYYVNQMTENTFVACKDCALAPELQEVILKTSLKRGINPAIVYAICESESTFRTDIGTEKLLGGSGCSRYYGYMQLSEYNCVRAEEIFGIDAHTEAGNLEYGTIVLSELVSKYGELDAVITAYKGGEALADSGVRLDCCDEIARRVMYWEERIVEE